MPNVTIQINARRPYGRSVPTGPEALRHWVNYLQSIASGEMGCDSVQVDYNDTLSVGSLASLGPACALFVGATLSGVVGVSLAGTAITVTASGGDAATCTALGAAINANTTVNNAYRATNRIASVTLASVAAGATLQVFGQTFTAVATSAAILDFGQFNIDGADSADAAALALAINRHPVLAGKCRAVSNSATVYVGLLEDRAPKGFEAIRNQAGSAGFTIGVGVPAAGAQLLVFSRAWGQGGNETRFTTSGAGSGHTVATNGSAGFMGNGTGGGTLTNTAYITP